MQIKVAGKNTILLEVKIDDNGTLKVVQKEAKASAKAVDSLTQSTDKASTSKNRYNTLEKGTGELTNNSTKAFAKQAKTIGSGLVPAYATLAANIFAITAAFGALQRAAQFEQLQKGLEYTGNAAGVNLTKVAEGLKEITGEAIGLREAMTAVALGISAGFSTKQLEGLTKVAKGASLALGRDMEDAMSRLTRGAAKLEPEILDELGIMVRLDDATEAYATKINKTVGELTQYERRQAFANAIIEQGIKKFGELAENVDANPYDKLAASFKALATEGLSLTNTVFGPFISFLSKSPTALLGILTLFGSTVVKKMIPSLEDMSAAAEASAKNVSLMSAKQLAAVGSLDGASKKVQELQKKMQEGTATQKDFNSALHGAVTSVNVNRAALLKLTEAEGESAEKIARKTAMYKNSIVVLNAMTKANFQATQAQISLNAVNAIEEVQRGRLILGLKLYKDVVIQYYQSTLLGIKGSIGLQKAIIGVSGAARIASLSFQTLFAVFSRALPIIGQLIFAYSLLQQYVFPLFGKSVSETAKALTEADEQTKQFEKTQTQLGTTLRRQGITAVEAYAAGLKAMAGEATASAGQIATLIDTIILDSESRIKEIEENMGFFAKAFAAVNEAAATIYKGGPTVENRPKDTGILTDEQRQGALTAAQVRLNSLTREFHMLTESTTLPVSAIADIAKALDPLVKAIDEFGSKSKATGEDAQVLIDAANKTQVAFNSLQGVIEDSVQTTSKIKEFLNTKDELTGPFTDNIKLLETTLGQFKTNKSIEVLPNLAENMKSLGVNAQNIEAVTKNLISLNNALALTGVRTEEAKAAAEKLREKGTVESAIAAEKVMQTVYEKNIALLNQALNVQNLSIKDRLDFQLDLARNEKELARSKSAEVEIVQKEQVKIATQLMDQIELKKQLLDVEKSIREEIQKRAEIQLDIARSEATVRGLGTIGKTDELLIARQAAELKIVAAKESLKFLKSGIQLEIDLASAKLQVEYAKYNLNREITDEERAVLNAQAAVLGIQGSLLQQRTETAEMEVLAAEKALEAIKAQGISGIGTSGGAIGALVDTDRLNIANKDTGQKALEQFTKGDTVAKLRLIRTEIQGVIDFSKELGPDGEVLYAVSEGAFAMAEAFADAFERIEDGGSKLIATIQIIGSTINALAAVQQAQSKASIAAIDREIEAEKRRDGKSSESVAKIIALEKKKESAERKAFERDKKMKMAQTVINTAAAVVNALASTAPPFNFVLAGLIAAMGAAQLAIIAGTTYQGGGAGINAAGTGAEVGSRSNVVDLATSRSPAGELAYFQGQRGTSTAGANNYVPAFAGMQFRAAGGNAGIMVGEQGPEVFVPEVPGRIIPADEANKLGNSLNVNFEIKAIDSRGMKEVLRSQRGNIISMIREAANAQGEFFLENITEFDRDLGAVA